MAIIEAAATVPMKPLDILEKARRLGIQSAESSVDLIRADRDRDQPR